MILTIDPKLQEAAQAALSDISGGDRDAAVVAITPKTGAVLADYSTADLRSGAARGSQHRGRSTKGQEFATLANFKRKDREGFSPGLPLATPETFFPGSTFKVVAPAAVPNLDPSLVDFTFPRAGSTTFPNSDKVMTNDGGEVCGGTMADDINATSCDPGYGQLGVELTAPTLVQQAHSRLQHTPPDRSTRRLGGHPDDPCGVDPHPAQTRKGSATPQSANSMTRAARFPTPWWPPASRTVAPS